MDGSSDDTGAPDSWELADLDASMSRLLVSSKKISASPSSSPPDTLHEAAQPEAVAGLAERGGAASVSEDAVAKVDQFLREALEKPRERLAILRMEQDVLKFIHDPTQQQLEFQGLPTSYLRLAAHRIAQHYYLQSIVIPDNSLPDGSGSRILLHKTSYDCQLPPVRLADIPVNFPQEDNSAVFKVAIKQRPQKWTQSVGGANSHSSRINHLKSVEERKEEYNRARARIFNSSNSSGAMAKSEDEIKLPDSLQDFVSVRSNEKVIEGPENYLGMGCNDPSSGSSRLNRIKTDKEPTVNRSRPNPRVAIFRDREVDRKDPDYDRSYDRYMQRFDPGFGFNGGTYAMQPLYSPAVNYNTEFPQLGVGHRTQIPSDHQPRPVPQHMSGLWPGATAGAVNYGRPEGMMPPFNPNFVGAQSTSSIYMHSSQYPIAPRPGLSYIHPHQPFAQTHQKQPEASFGLARPR